MLGNQKEKHNHVTRRHVILKTERKRFNHHAMLIKKRENIFGFKNIIHWIIPPTYMIMILKDIRENSLLVYESLWRQYYPNILENQSFDTYDG